jgi:hypothetical protein
MLFPGKMAKSYFKQEHDLGKRNNFFSWVGDLINLIE